VDETLRVVDGVLSAHPERWLADEVEMVDSVSGAVTRGARDVALRLRELMPVGNVRLTLDIARGAAEWGVDGPRPIVAVFDVEHDRVKRIRLYAGSVDTPDPRDHVREKLTRREFTIASLVASGMTNDEVAADLVVSRKTIEFHLRNIFRKLSVSNRTQLASLFRPKD
jgi:DNA-binding CsgD family transcriptional regulator